MNVVILFNETHVHDYLGCAGLPFIQTPTADALAADGVRFTQAVCAATPCLPSRHNLIFGLHAFQTGIYTNAHALSPNRIPDLSMGKAFQRAGYRTAACGKMHMFPYGIVMERGNYFGFDYRAGHFRESGETMDTCFPAEHRPIVEQFMAERARHGVSKGGDGCAVDYIGYHSELRNNQSADWWAAQKAASFIDARANSPFLLFCSLVKPHPPNAVYKDFAGLYDSRLVALPPEPPGRLPDEGFYTDKERYGEYNKFLGLSRDDLKTIIARYMACVTAADVCHSQVVEALRCNGLYDDTLIIYTADHGDLMGSRGPCAFSKYNLYENAIRVPLIIKPPKSLGSWTPGSRRHAPISLLDVLPTLLDAAGLPGRETLPGRSLRPLLFGEPLERETPICLTEFSPGWGKGAIHLSVRTPQWKLILGALGDELYDLRNDPSEFCNLGNDPSQRARIASMKSDLIDYYRQVFRRGHRAALEYDRRAWGLLD